MLRIRAFYFLILDILTKWWSQVDDVIMGILYQGRESIFLQPSAQVHFAVQSV